MVLHTPASCLEAGSKHFVVTLESAIQSRKGDNDGDGTMGSTSESSSRKVKEVCELS